MTTYVTGLECLDCGATFEDRPMFDGCPSCRTDAFVSNVAPTYDYDAIADAVSRADFGGRGGVWDYPELLPVAVDHAVTLDEGATPLVDCPALGEEWGVELLLKDESRNPTWSYKDRLCSVAVSKARSLGHDVVTIASTGNHGASTAAYAGRAGLESVIFTLPSVPETMKTLMGVYGASVVATPTPEDRWTLMAACIDAYGWYPTGNYVYPPVGSNFYGIEGYKTIAYETCAALDWEVPDWVVLPTAYADGLSGVWRGFKDLHELGLVDERPRMAAVEPFGPLANALERDLDRVEPVESGDTVAFSISAGISTQQGLVALRESGGTAVVTEDPAIMELQRTLGRTTGLYAEASAVAAVAGVERLRETGDIDAGDRVVALSTSTGLKDTATTAEGLPAVPTIEPDLDQLRAALDEHYGIEL